MSSRHKIYWRVYIYANSLYSLPSRSTCSYRPWNPVVFRRKSYELQRIMIWVNRDLSVLLRNGKWEMLVAYDAILNLLPMVNMKSREFTETVQLYLGDKTRHFVHELINFARSPYDDLISYECNVQYCTIDKLGHKVDAGISTKMTTDLELHSFVEFSLRINDDDCSGFEADLDQENEDWEEDNSAAADVLDRSLMLMRRPNTTTTSAQINSPHWEGIQPASGMPLTRAQLLQNSQLPPPHLRRYIPGFGGTRDLEVAVERSMVNGQSDDNAFFIPNSNNFFMAIPPYTREPLAPPSDVISPPPPPSMPLMHNSGLQNNRGGSGLRGRRRRKVGWGPFTMQ